MIKLFWTGVTTAIPDKATLGNPSPASNFSAGQLHELMLRAPMIPPHTGLEGQHETELAVPCPAGSPTSSSTMASSHPSMTDLAGLVSSNSNDVPTRRESPVDNMLGIAPAPAGGVNKRHRRSYSAPLHGGRWDQLIRQATGARLALT